MNDSEINKAVAEKLSLRSYTKTFPGGTQEEVALEMVSTPDYCNSWADAGSIIEKHGISMIFERADDCCTSMVINRINQGGQIEADITHENKSPLVAAMLVFLEMDI